MSLIFFLYLNLIKYFFKLLIVCFVDNSFQEFVNSPCMTEIKERSCFIHIDVPGHADNAEALPERYL